MINIYIIKNKVNNLVYIGQTNRKIEYRLSTHINHAKIKKSFSLEMEKVGFNNFYIELLDKCRSRKMADIKEAYYIGKYNSVWPNGYNKQFGGTRKFRCSDEMRANMSKGHIGKKHQENVIEKMRASSYRKRRTLCLNNNKEYNSASDAARDLGLRPTSVSRVAAGLRPMTHNFKFKYLE